MNFSILIPALLIAFALKEAIILLDHNMSEGKRIISFLNVGGCVIALVNYQQWLV